MRNIDRCSCGGAETDKEIPGTPGPDGEDFVDNDYLFATEDSPEWYDEDEHARRRYVQPDPEVNENVYSVTEEACQNEQCGEPCGAPPDCGDACDCGTGKSGCSDLCEACGCPAAPAPAQRRNGGQKCFDPQKAREESIRRNHARAARRRKILQDTIDSDERIRRRENALKQQEACAEGKPGGEGATGVSPAQEPELSCLPEELYVSPVEMENMEPAPCEEEKAWPEIPVFDVGPVCGFAGDPCIQEQQQAFAYTENAVEEGFALQEEPWPRQTEKTVPAPQPDRAYDIYEKAERFAQDDTIDGCCMPEGDGCGGNDGNNGGEECECCCKGEDCDAPDYNACELDEDCCGPESAFFMQGSFGDEVRKIQRCMKNIPAEQGGTPVLEVDGIYGPNTAMAVMRFQEQHNIPADGVTNKRTRARMQKLCPDSAY